MTANKENAKTASNATFFRGKGSIYFTYDRLTDRPTDRSIDRLSSPLQYCVFGERERERENLCTEEYFKFVVK